MNQNYKQTISNSSLANQNQFQTCSQTLKRIKSELETIQENKKEGKEMDDSINNQAYMENIMVDESYSFSLRQFGKQASKKDLGHFDQSRISNLSAYGGQGDSSQRGNNTALNSVPATESRRRSSKVVVNSHDFGPFSKTRRAQENRLRKNSSKLRNDQGAYLKTQVYDGGDNIELRPQKILETNGNYNESASALGDDSAFVKN